MTTPKKENENQLDSELSEEVAEGIYSNLAIISHSNAEFVVDFVRMLPGVPKAKVKSRIVLTPQHAKRLLKAIADNISKFEALHGDIKDNEGFGGKVGAKVGVAISKPAELENALTTIFDKVSESLLQKGTSTVESAIEAVSKITATTKD